MAATTTTAPTAAPSGQTIRERPPHRDKRPAGLAYKQPPWSDGEVAYLRSHYRYAPTAQMAEHLGRSVAAVQRKAGRTERLRYYGDLTLAEVAQVLGRSTPTVGAWLRTGRLRGTQAGVSATWRVTPADLRTFCHEHPGELHAAQADMLWLIELLTGPTGSPASKKAR